MKGLGISDASLLPLHPWPPSHLSFWRETETKHNKQGQANACAGTPPPPPGGCGERGWSWARSVLVASEQRFRIPSSPKVQSRGSPDLSTVPAQKHHMCPPPLALGAPGCLLSGVSVGPGTAVCTRPERRRKASRVQSNHLPAQTNSLASLNMCFTESL